jgi:hypothetical protein
MAYSQASLFVLSDNDPDTLDQSTTDRSVENIKEKSKRISLHSNFAKPKLYASPARQNRVYKTVIMSESINDPAAAAATSGSSLPAEEVQIDLTKLNALSSEVISKQATVSSDLERRKNGRLTCCL